MLDYMNIDSESLKECLRLPSQGTAELNVLKLDVVEESRNLFSKIKILKSKQQTFSIPASETFFTAEAWKLLPMQILEEELNAVKSLLNDVPIEVWHEHTRSMNPLSSVIKEIRRSYSHEFCSIAWCKLYEILSLHNAIPRATQEAGRQLNEIMLHSIHLCEAPGAFISALNHYLKTTYSMVHWKWLATTLNPYYEGNDRSETLIQDQIILSSINNWTFLEDNSGNIMDRKNILSLGKEARKLKHVQLVTADGSIDCANSPDEQESVTSDLHYCEIMAALQVLDKGGSFVLKMFTFFCCNSISKLYLLSCLFQEVEVVKPAMSKGGNSEVYIICRGYAGPEFLAPEKMLLLDRVGEIPKEKSMFPLETIPKEFLNRVIDCSLFFATQQVQVTQRNVKSYPFGKEIYQNMWCTKEILAQNWLEMTYLTSLKSKDYIFDLKKMIKRYCFKDGKSGAFEGSYNDRMSRNKNKTQPTWIVDIISELESAVKLSLIATQIMVELPSVNKFCPKWGKQFDNVKCSRFCPDNVLQLNQALRQFVGNCFESRKSNVKLKADAVFHCSHEQLVLALEKSSCGIEAQYQKKMKVEYHAPQVLCYNEDLTCENLRWSDYKISRNYFHRLHSVLKDLHIGQDLFLCSYPLLTRLHFGIATLISNFFQSGQIYCEFNPCQKESRKIGVLYNNFQGVLGKNQLWKDLETTLIASDDSNPLQILEIVHVATLCKKKICVTAMKYNVQLVLQNLQDKVKATQKFFVLIDELT